MVDGQLGDMIDVLLPTEGKRMDGLIFQIQSILNQSYRSQKLWVLIDSDSPRIIESTIRARLSPQARFEIKVVPEEWRGNWGHRPIKWALEHLPLEGEWVITSGDDDCIMEWALQRLAENTKDVDMVVGFCIPTTREHDAVPLFLGDKIEKGKITGSCCLYRRSRLMEVGYDDSTYEADWDLIEKMLEFPYRQVASVLFVMPQSF